MNTLNVVESVFFAALDQTTPEARNKYLDEACKGDDKLRQVVEKLLNAHPKANSFLKSPAIGQAVTTDAPTVLDEKPGMSIGPFKLLQQLGEGGFGVVFMAEQEKPVRRKVALKIIKPGMDSKQVIARFEAERQALALMDHPNIARVLDGGTTDSGRPYFVMELVKGVPITEFCDKNRLTPRERLELFIPVCQAVQHAHQKGIIHRDLKPSNVLVTLYDDKPVPKVIDFGIAKAIEQKLTEQTLFTRIGQVVGTLEYMSPEQATLNALDVDTRADVYALGVLMYELLTGSTPHDKTKLEGKAFLEMLRIIREEEPPKPSTRLSQATVCLPVVANYRKVESQKLPKLVKGELDWIAMKALEKDRTRRYATANALAADVQRYLKDEQVEACPPSVGYRLRKYASRHKAAFTIAAAVAATLLLGIVATTWQAIQARRAEQLAMAERDAAEQARETANRQSEVADQERLRATQERDNAQATRETLRRTLYATSMNLIPTSWNHDNVTHVQRILDSLSPKPGEEDLRGFEWHYWDRQCHAEIKQWNVGKGLVSNAQVSGDGTRVAYSETVNEGQDLVNTVFKVVEVATQKEICSITRPGRIAPGPIGTAISINHDGSRLLVCGAPIATTAKPVATPETRGQITLYEIPSGKVVFSTETTALRPAVVLSRDGHKLAMVQRVASSGPSKGSSSASVQIWDADHAAEKPVSIKLDKGTVGSVVAFSPDGSRLAGINVERPDVNAGAGGLALTINCKIIEWETSTGKVLNQVSQPGKMITSLTYNPDGTQLFTNAQEIRSNTEIRKPLIQVYQAAPGAELNWMSNIAIPDNNTSSRNLGLRMVINPSGKLLLMYGNDNPPRIYDVTSGMQVQTIHSTHAIGSAAFAPDGKRMITASQNTIGEAPDQRIAIIQEWDVVEITPPLAPGRRPASVGNRSASWNTDQSRRAVYQGMSFRNGLNNSKTDSEPVDPRLISIQDREGKELLVFKKHTSTVRDCLFSPDGKLILSRSMQSEVFLWEVETGKVLWSYAPADQPQGSDDNWFSPNSQFSVEGSRLILEGPGNTTLIRSVPDGKEIATIHGKIVQAGVSHSKFLVTSHRNQQVTEKNGQPVSEELKVLDIRTGQEVKTLSALPGTPVTFSHDGSWLLIITLNESGTENVIQIWNTRTWERRISFPTGNRTISTASRIFFSPDGNRLLVQDIRTRPRRISTATIWDLSTGKALGQLEGLETDVQSIIFSPDSKRIATLTNRGFADIKLQVKLWDVTTGRELLDLTNNTRSKNTGVAFWQLSFSPDGRRLTATSVLQPLISVTTHEEYTWDATPRLVGESRR